MKDLEAVVDLGQVARWRRELAGAEPAQVVAWAAETFGQGLTLACSFSVEDTVVLQLWKQAARDVDVFALDTGRLPEATYRAAATLAHKYEVELRWFCPQAEAVQQLLRSKGAYSFRDGLAERHECCAIRKVEPLGRALFGYDAWLTGLRRGQAVTRAAIEVVEVDEAHRGMVKINPLANWDRDQVLAYAEEHGVPLHPLHREGYPSIGCEPCTRAVKPGEHERAGRWWWEDPTHKECGLHPVKTTL